MNRPTAFKILTALFPAILFAGCGNDPELQVQQLTVSPRLYDRIEFQISVSDTFASPFDSRSVELNMILEAPSGKQAGLPGTGIVHRTAGS